MTSWRRRLEPLLRRLGFETTQLHDATWLVTRPPHAPRTQRLSDRLFLVKVDDSADEDPYTVDEVEEDGALVLQPSGRRRRALLQMGRRELRTHLLVDRRAARANMRQHQRHLYQYLADEHIGWMLRELGINCVIDVGANIGQFGSHLRHTGYRGRIVSFEPLPHLARRLEDSAQDDPDWLVFNHALGSADGELEMNVTEGTGVTSSLLPASEFGRAWSSRLRETSTQTIRVHRLDEIFDEVVSGIDAPRVYLKMDTQGYDMEVFAGAGDRIKEVVGMQSEVSCVPIYDGMPRLPEQIAVYEAAGFENTGMFPVTRDPQTHRVIEYDAVMIRTEALGTRERG
jgi:FkbM family methyltransferase